MVFFECFQVRAGESLMKFVSDLKQFMILNDFPSVNDSIHKNTKACKTQQQDMDNKLTSLRDEMAMDLFELEDEYYSSAYKWRKPISVLFEDHVNCCNVSSSFYCLCGQTLFKWITVY